MKRSSTRRPNLECLEGRTLLSTVDPMTLFTYGDSYVPNRTDLATYRAVLDSQSVVDTTAHGSLPPTVATSTPILGAPGSDPGELGPLAISHVEYTFGDSA